MKIRRLKETDFVGRVYDGGEPARGALSADRLVATAPPYSVSALWHGMSDKLTCRV